jgi:hypothetical protein
LEERLFPLDGAKRCCTCKVVQPLDAFNRMKKSPDGRQASCREGNRRYHYENWDRHMAQIRRRNLERRARNRSLARQYSESHPCADCGLGDIVVLEFDHLRDKKQNISWLIRNGETKTLFEEIAKCEVVCANCHRRRTAARGGFWKLRE